MKFNRYISLVLAGTLAGGMAVSCLSDEEFLTEKPKDIITTQNAFNTSDQVLNTVLTGYWEYEELAFPGGMGMGMNYQKASGTDLTDGKFANTHMSNFARSWSSTSSLPKQYWDKFYKIISYANLAISKADDVEWASETVKARVIAEARFLRGLSYLRLGELFGGVPMQEVYSEAPNYAFERAERAYTFQFAKDDLLAAFNGLPANVQATEYGRAGKGAAALYLSEACLALGVAKNDDKKEFEDAAKYAEECIKIHPIMKDRFGVRLPGACGSNYGIATAYEQGNVFSDLFYSENVKSAQNTEAVWVMVAAKNNAQWSSSGHGIWNGGSSHRGCTLGLTPAIQDYIWAKDLDESQRGPNAGPWKNYSAKWGGAQSPAFQGGIGWAQETPTDFAAYTMWDAEHNFNSPGDLRYTEDVTVMTTFLCCDDASPLYEQKVGWNEIDHSTSELASTFYPIFQKEVPFDAWEYDEAEPSFWLGGGKFGYYYRSKYGARSSEAYLFLAEAKLRAGDKDGAAKAINAVRERAKATPVTASQMNINVILDERGRELLFEEFRWATLLRMKPTEWKQRIYDYGKYSARTGAPVYDPSVKGQPVRRWAEFTGEIEFDFFPIPNDYILLNKDNPEGMSQNRGW